MSRKLPGSAIVSGSITLDQISGSINDTTNAAYSQANTARNTANDAYGQANAARSDANTTFATVNTTFGTINTNYQAAYAQANTARGTANDAYAAANTKLSTSGGSISGDLAITGNLTVTGNATTINVTNLSVNDSMILLSTNAVGDSNDIGFIGHFDRDATATHAGLIRKATENRFYLFDNYEVEPTNNVIDVAGNNFRVGNLRLGIINANSYVTSAGLDVTGQANTARNTANDAYAQANTARNTANSAYGQANTATTNAGNAYDTANSAFTASSRLRTDDTRTIAPSTHTAGRLTFGFTSYTNNGNASTYADYLHFRSYTDSSGGSDNLVMFHKSGIGMRIWQQTWNSSTAYSNYVDVLHSSNYSSYAVPLSGGTMTGTLVVNASTAEIYARSSGGANGQILADGSNLYVGPVGAHGLRLQTNGTTRILIDSSGNVGIGTTNPHNARLHASGVGTGPDLGTTAVANATAVFSNSDRDYGMYFAVSGNGNGAIQQRRGAAAVYYDLLLQPYGGNVGIGTASTSNKLDVIGNVLIQGTQGFNATDETASLYIGDNASEIRAVYDRGLDFYQNGTHRMRIQGGTGNVGIGMTEPAYKLHVRDATNTGNIAIGHITYPGVIYSNAGSGEFRIDNRASSSSGYITFYPNGQQNSIGNEAMRINTNGRVGIANTNPERTLHVEGISYNRGEIIRPTVYGGDNSGTSSTIGSYVLGAGKYWTVSSGAKYVHILLPARYNANAGASLMWCIEVKGYDFNAARIINLMIGGYVTPVSNGGPMSQIAAWDSAGSGVYSPTAYFSSNYSRGVARFYLSSSYYASFTINTIASGNGDVIAPDELTIIESVNATI